MPGTPGRPYRGPTAGIPILTREAEDIGVTFKDVSGADEAIAQLQETVQFLKTPQKFATPGAHVPKDVRLVAPSGVNSACTYLSSCPRSQSNAVSACPSRSDVCPAAHVTTSRK